ncbi:hypothetical protein PsorP6_011941 [Peronosclerospora sorghi]|uniref:Uncharacterized protein n=1 Tax=Peronosclerospora sorghi TaxID=230839 RepID=A0ACC0WIB5_9STRA|nr:hypothetical protein PsorP6_011941 [Peronosclerospora sorghi]
MHHRKRWEPPAAVCGGGTKSCDIVKRLKEVDFVRRDYEFYNEKEVMSGLLNNNIDPFDLKLLFALEENSEKLNRFLDDYSKFYG